MTKRLEILAQKTVFLYILNVKVKVNCLEVIWMLHSWKNMWFLTNTQVYNFDVCQAFLLFICQWFFTAVHSIVGRVKTITTFQVISREKWMKRTHIHNIHQMIPQDLITTIYSIETRNKFAFHAINLTKTQIFLFLFLCFYI